jgi:hypothetical protein
LAIAIFPHFFQLFFIFFPENLPALGFRLYIDESLWFTRLKKGPELLTRNIPVLPNGFKVGADGFSDSIDFPN